MQRQSLRLSLCLLARKGVDPPPAPLEHPPAPSAHLAVQEAVEDRDEEALEGDKQQSYCRATASRQPQAQELWSNPGFGDVWFWEGAEAGQGINQDELLHIPWWGDWDGR